MPALLYVGDTYTEVVCKVRDISERGIAFEITLSEAEKGSFRVGDSIEFQFMDTFRFGSEVETDLISKHCLIRHVTEAGSSLIIGCYLADKEFAQYVMHKEVAGQSRL